MAITPTESVPFDSDSTLTHLDPPGRRALRHASAVTALLIYAVYLGYRGLYTLNPDALVFSLAVYFAEIHGFFSLFFYYFQVWTMRGRIVRPPMSSPTVDVFITTFNEEVDLLRQTVRAAVNMRYPHRTFVLDDGRRAEVRALCEELGCDYITRDTNEHAKAGNWNNAFATTTGTLIATFDADHVPRADFLERTLGFFDDPRVALVQTPQRYHNLDSLQHRVSWRMRRMYGEQDVFFNLVMPGKDHWNSSFFCGTGAVLRREALEPFGGQLTGTITEDMHTSLALQASGWKSVYLNELLVTGLAPMDFASYSSQRLRWAEGNLKIIRHVNPLTVRGLTLAQRLCYFASMYHWTIGFAKLVFYLAPPLMLFTGQFPIVRFDRQFFAFYLVHVVSLVVSYKILSRGTGRILMDELFNMANFFTLLVAAKRFLFGRGESKFVVTSKRGGDQDDRVVLPQYVLIGITLMSLVWSLLGLGFGVSEDVFGASIAAFWSFYNLALMLAVVGLALRPTQKRQAVRFRAAVPVEVLAGGDGGLGVTLDISEGGCTLLLPQPLPVGTALRLRLSFGAQTLECGGTVRTMHKGRRSGWAASGVQFHTDVRTADRLADAIYNMTVPEIFAHLSQPSWAARQWRYLSMRVRGGLRSRAARHEAYLPVRIIDQSGELLATTRDLSASGLSLVAPRSIAVGSRVTVVMSSSGRDSWTSAATVVRCAPVTAPRPEFSTFQLALRADAADGRDLAVMLSTEAA